MSRWLTGLGRVVAKSLAVIAVLILCGNVAHADPLDPLAFTSLGTFNPAANVSIDTSALTMSGGFTGVLSGVVAVFDFDSITLAPGLTISVVGSRPLALLSRQNASVAGTILLGGGTGGDSNVFIPFPGVPGQGVAGGGDGGLAALFPTGVGQPGVGGGGKGGDAGTSSVITNGGPLYGGSGGGGGGAIEIGAIDALDLEGSSISARGGAGGAGGAVCADCFTVSGGRWFGEQGGEGGGGGTILLAASTVSVLFGSLDVSGGAGGISGCDRIDPAQTIPIFGCGGPGNAGADGHIIIEGSVVPPSPVSEPSMFVFFACALAGLAGYAWRARHRT